MKLKHYLIASETNDYRPWITSSSSLVFFTAIIWALRLAVPASLTLAATYLNPADLMSRINTERSQRNIVTLNTNDKLIVAAQSKADDMLARSYFSHVDPDGQYVWPRIEAAGYKPYTTLGENLAMDFTTPDELVAAWMNSPTHRQNIVNTQFQDQGLSLAAGLYEPNHNTSIVVSLFGTLQKKSTTTPTATPPATPTATKSGTTTGTQPVNSTVTIGSDAKVGITQVSGHKLVSVNLSVSGSPTLVTAVLKGQTITLLPESGKFDGTFTFNSSEVLDAQKITVEARDSANHKVSSSITLTDTSTVESDANPASAGIPVSESAQLMKVLRIIFGILSVIYLSFLIIDEVIIRREHIHRAGMHTLPQIIIFSLVAFINLYGKF